MMIKKSVARVCVAFVLIASAIIGVSATAETRPGPPWHPVVYNTTGFLNANSTHTVNHTIGGVAVPHVYDNDGLGTQVWVS